MNTSKHSRDADLNSGDSHDDRQIGGGALLALVVLAASWGLSQLPPQGDNEELLELSSQLATATNIGMVVGVPVLLSILWLVGAPSRRELVAASISGLAGAAIFLMAVVAVGYGGLNLTWSLVALFLVAIPFSRWVYRRFSSKKQGVSE